MPPPDDYIDLPPNPHPLPPAQVSTEPHSGQRVEFRGRVRGASNYTIAETMNFLRIMERVVPCDLEEWSTVLESHSVRYPGRTVESLRRKYMTLHRKKAPTGDPDVPEHIALAKTVFEAIGDKASIGRGDDIFDMEGDGAFVAADGTRSTVPTPVNYAHANTQQSDTGSTATDVSPERVGGRRGGRNGKSDFMSIFLAQMQAESQARADERAERAEE